MSSGLVWELRLLFMLAITTIVIANHHQHHHDNSSIYRHFEEITGNHKLFLNSSRSQAQINTQWPSLKISRLRHHHVNHWDPYFENAKGEEINGPEHVALHLGATALLDCRVVMLSDKTVMWTRQDAEIPFLLTVGQDVHISDPRYSINFRYPNNFRLSIASVRREDHGQYACQVNTHPPRTLITNVTVLAPEITIMDEAGHELRDRYYKMGSSIELACIVRPSRPNAKVPQPTWFKSGESLPDHVTVYHMNGTNNEVMVGLHIKKAKKVDSGEYTCSIGEFSKSSVQIHVLNGEKQAAVHHDQWNSARSNYPLSLTSLFAALISQFFL
ncbi:zwei Ig domain protein zig-8-like [Chelonus insularis]|uniref:zwei Ig domain protein zig-8-like n=1 Tax=Chelonus insularis TaxID=460826 RepID=UPI00158B0E3A|nr:zwei Ig domain protein zig-8-like [Chelonus insularis]XP_034939014.1 zwei Ig domain protein zig-8-like [Chelonus insularis]